MNVLAVDDEELYLEFFIEELKGVFPKDMIEGKTSMNEALEYVDELLQQGEVVQYAFLDIELGSNSGIELAKMLKEKCPKMKILFCTAYSQYGCEAYQLHAIGYLLKPVTAQAITSTLREMDRDWKSVEYKEPKIIKIQTFGHFEVFIDGQAIHFERKKVKELLAYLVDRRGAGVTSAEVAGVLWEDKPYTRSVMNQTQNMISLLKKKLKQEGIQDILVKSWNQLSIDPSQIVCDAYEFYKGDTLAINAYRGEYMVNYSWAEFTNGELYFL